MAIYTYFNWSIWNYFKCRRRCIDITGLTHWGRMTHICLGKLTITGSDNGLSPGRCQATIWTKAAILSIRPLGTNFCALLIEIQTFPFKKMRSKVSSAKWWQFCLGLNIQPKRLHSLWSLFGVTTWLTLWTRLSCQYSSRANHSHHCGYL